MHFRRSRFVPVLLVSLILIGWTTSMAQGTNSNKSINISGLVAKTPAIKPVLDAVRLDAKPRIDGVVDEVLWQEASLVNQFWQKDPDEGESISEPTEVRMFYSDDALYVSFICFDSEPEKIERKLTRRDRDVPSDMVGIVIDSYNDDRTGFGFALNAAGVKLDLLFQNDGENQDTNWDAIWDGKVAQRPDGWSAEFRIPYRVLRFVDSPVQDWGLNLVRIISRKNEEAWWAFASKETSGFVSHFGSLEGIKGIEPSRSLQIAPYALSGATAWPGNEEPAYLNRVDPQFRVGLDAQYGLTNSSILTMTVNPDFGQVEADEAVLNLSAFETFFPEKRPFFLEGTDIFQTVGALGDDGPRTELFYTRRIGKRPGDFYLEPDELDLTEWKVASNPTATPILGAAKLSGKTDNGWSYGLINALTPRTFKTFENPDGDQKKYLTEPLSNFSVARTQYALPGPASYIGAIATGVVREGSDFGNAYSAGVDFRYNKDDYSLATEGILAGTRRITPDGEEQGYHGQFRIGNHSRPKFVYQTGVNFTTSGFNANDLGFSQGDDNLIGFVWGQYRNLQPHGAFRQFRLNTSIYTVQNLAGWSRQEAGLSSNVFMQWKNYWHSAIGTNLNSDGLDPYESRGEGIFRSPRRINFWAFVSSDSRKPVSLELNPMVASDEYGMSSWSLQLPIEVRIGTRSQFSISPSISQSYDGVGWADNVDGENGETVSVFGYRDVDRTSVTLRALHTFTPELTLQAYTQYFWARGKYESFNRLLPDGSLSVEDYAYDGNPDFNMSSVNLNVIARYEYRPGSTVFLVWTHGRELFEDDTTISASRFLQNTIDYPATNVVLLKWTYNLGL